MDAPAYHAKCSFISSHRYKKNYGASTLIGTYQSLSRHVNKLPGFKSIIYDEVHTSSCASGLKVLSHFPDAVHTGYTATPKRLDNKPLDYVYNELKLCPVSVRELIDQGYLADFELYGLPLDGFDDAYAERDRSIDMDGLSFQQSYLSNNAISQKVYDNWKELAYGTPTLINASGIVHAERICQLFNQNIGYKAFAFMHNKMTYKEQKEVMSAIETGALMGVVHINMLGMGIDINALQTCVLLRRTNSLTIHGQQMGRTLRPKPSGAKAKYLDFVGNLTRLGSPTFPYPWSLESDPDQMISDPIIECPNCSYPVCNRSKIVKQLYRYKETGNFGLPVIGIGESKTHKIPTKIYCDNCKQTFDRNFMLQVEEKQERDERYNGIVRDDSILKLSRLSDVEINNYILNGRLNEILTEDDSSQRKRSAIIKGNFSLKEKYLALKKAGESESSIAVLLDL